MEGYWSLPSCCHWPRGGLIWGQDGDRPPLAQKRRRRRLVFFSVTLQRPSLFVLKFQPNVCTVTSQLFRSIIFNCKETSGSWNTIKHCHPCGTTCLSSMLRCGHRWFLPLWLAGPNWLKETAEGAKRKPAGQWAKRSSVGFYTHARQLINTTSDPFMVPRRSMGAPGVQCMASRLPVRGHSWGSSHPGLN